MKICEALITNTTLTTLNLRGDDKHRKERRKEKKEARQKSNRNEGIEEENKMK